MLTRLVHQIGDVVEFQTGKGERRKNWAKLNFGIEVAEVSGHKVTSALISDDEVTKTGGASLSEGREVADGSETDGKDVTVTIDPQEHQSYAWVTAEDIAAGKYTIATPEQRELILEAFLTRQDVGGNI